MTDDELILLCALVEATQATSLAGCLLAEGDKWTQAVVSRGAWESAVELAAEVRRRIEEQSDSKYLENQAKWGE